MRQRFYSLSLQKLTKQRNQVLVVGSILGVSNLILCGLLFFTPQRVVVIPANPAKSFWVDQRQVSPEYLEEMGLFFAREILDVSPASAAYQRDVVLRYTAPEYHNALKKRLIEEERRAGDGQISTGFKPIQIKVNAERLEAELTGDLLSYVAGKMVSSVRESYLLRFQYTQGRLLVTQFKLISEGAEHEAP